MSDADLFYRERDQRSLECGALTEALKKPVTVVIGNDGATTRAGQVAVLGLANLLARVHRDVTFVFVTRAAPLLVSSMIQGSSLDDAVLSTMRSIDPYGRFEIEATASDCAVTLGIGDVWQPATFYVGVCGTDAVFARTKVSIDDIYGALGVIAGGLAACLGAAVVYQAVHEHTPMPEMRVSAWTLEQRSDAASSCAVPANIPSTIDVGDVVLVGAGAVAAALAYWVRQIGHVGHWYTVDGDIVKLHNTNRGMLFLPLHAGWRDGRLDESAAASKAKVVAAALDAKPFWGWYHDWIKAVRPSYDLILPLANEYSVRHAITSLHEPILVHATTNQSGAAQLHRHIPSRDDCLDCRLPEKKVAQFTCSTSVVETKDGTSTDAALPFLSAAAGLMLTVALLRLQVGELPVSDLNFWQWNLLTNHLFVSSGRMSCDDSCMTLPSKALRRRLNEKKRWWMEDTY